MDSKRQQSTPSQTELDALQYGIDVSLIDYNLTLSYDERVRQHESARALVLELISAREALNSKP